MSPDRASANQARPRAAVTRIDGYQRNRPWLGLPLAVLYKFVDDQGNYLATIITYYGFVSLFPLLLLFVTIIGFLLRGNPALQRQLLDSALSQFPIVGQEIARSTHAITGSVLGVAVGVIGSLYGGIEVVQAAQNAFNRVWEVPRQDRPDPLRSRLRSFVLLPTMGAAVLLTTGMSGISTSLSSVLGAGARVGDILLSLALDIAVFLVAFHLLTGQRDRLVSDRPEVRSLRDSLPGAVLAGICWQVLQLAGTYIVTRRLHGAGAIAGTFGVVLGLLAWIYVQAVVTVLSAEINVVVKRRLWPRALLAIFSDTRELTSADKEAYTSYSRTERYKTFQRIEVEFRCGAGRETPAGDPDVAGHRQVRCACVPPRTLFLPVGQLGGPVICGRCRAAFASDGASRAEPPHSRRPGRPGP